jgi:hypothetical protein
MAKPTKLDALRERIGSGGQTVGELRDIGKSVGFWQDRFVARPAAELLIQQGAPGAEKMRATLQTMPITGRDKKADLLRNELRKALERDGIPPDVERVARSFYEHRKGASLGGQPAAPVRPGPEPGDQPGVPTSTPDVVSGIAGTLKRLFGGR